MNTIRAILFSVFVSALAQEAEPQVTPIVIYMRHENTASLFINDTFKSITETEAWLQEASSRFGRLDPVVIVVESNDDIYAAAVFARNALKTHDRVYIAIPKPGKADPKYYLLPVGSNEATFSI
ncbi:MAG: hypothetical protein WCP60_11875 [bacterium]